ncbi:unnamed protein product [Boreogadus saida]
MGSPSSGRNTGCWPSFRSLDDQVRHVAQWRRQCCSPGETLVGNLAEEIKQKSTDVPGTVMGSPSSVEGTQAGGSPSGGVQTDVQHVDRGCTVIAVLDLSLMLEEQTKE